MWTSAFSNRKRAARVVLSLGLLGSGCAYGQLHQVLRAQVASETDCPDVSVQKSSPYAPAYNPNQYTVRGCGVDRVYTCRDSGMVAYGHANCTYTAGATAKAAESAPASAEPPPLDEPTDLAPPLEEPSPGDVGEANP